VAESLFAALAGDLRIVAHEGAAPFVEHDDAGCPELPVGLHRRSRIDAEFHREVADGRQALPGPQDTGRHALAHGIHDLPVDRCSERGIQLEIEQEGSERLWSQLYWSTNTVRGNHLQRQSSTGYVRSLAAMTRVDTDDELRKELTELRARAAQLAERAAAAERDATRYRLLLQHLNVGVFVSSLDGVMLECNDRAVDMSGEARESLLTKNLSNHYENPDDRARLVAELRGKGSVRNFEVWTRQLSGKRVAASMNALLAPLGPGGTTVILGMLEDITERKLAQERAGESELRFRVLAEQSMLGIMIFQDDTLHFVNQAVSELNGYSVEEMTAWAAVDFVRVIHPDDAAFVIEQGRRTLARDPTALGHYTYRIVSKSGEIRWIDQYSRTIDYGGRPANFVTCIDITARKAAEESLGQLSASMERTAKLEALGVLAAGIAHDFNNLLGALFGHVELARAHLDKTNPAREHLELAGEAFERAKALTGQLLAFAKGGAPLRKVGSIATSVRQCAEFALSGSNVSVDFDLADDLWNAEYDANQLARALDNIVINAKQAMPSGGMLRVVGRNVLVDAGPALPLAPGRYVKLSFVDGGPGIPPAVLPRIFDPFFTTKAEGSGVGLTATYAILKKHDGHIEADSRPGEGATFHVWLPAVLEQASDARPAPVDPAKGRGLVLLMDDDDMVRHAAGRMLSHLGYDPVLARDGSEAVQRAGALLAEGVHLSAALLDLTVRSGAGGRDTVSPLRALVPGLPIVASSGYSDDPVMAEPERFGFDARLNKPFRLDELADLLARLVAR
jgi:PAS domain S-box-containing protein